MKKIDTYIFKTLNKKLNISVKSTFLNIIPNPESTNLNELLDIYNMASYYHNPNGPAIEFPIELRPTENHKFFENEIDFDITWGKYFYREYWIDGKRLSDEETRKFREIETQFEIELSKK